MNKLKLATLALTPIIPIVTVISCGGRSQKQITKDKIDYKFSASEPTVEKISEKLTIVKVKVEKPQVKIEPKDFAMVYKYADNKREFYIIGSYFEDNYVVFEIKNYTESYQFEIYKIVVGEYTYPGIFNSESFVVKSEYDLNFKFTVTAQPWMNKQEYVHLRNLKYN